MQSDTGRQGSTVHSRLFRWPEVENDAHHGPYIAYLGSVGITYPKK